MGQRPTVDRADARILLAMSEDPRATVLGLAEATGLSRNTVAPRLAHLERDGVLEGVERRISPLALGYPMKAFIKAQVHQQLLEQVGCALAAIAEVVEVTGISGPVDLLIQVVASDAEDLYRTAGRILNIDGVQRTETALVMRSMVDFRLRPLLSKIAQT
jgi:DNA-binding Lrp family transcriptional regulator